MTHRVIGNVGGHEVWLWTSERYETNQPEGIMIRERPADGRPPLTALETRSLCALLLSAAEELERRPPVPPVPVRRWPPVFRCQECQHEAERGGDVMGIRDRDPLNLPCPKCGSKRARVQVD